MSKGEGREHCRKSKGQDALSNVRVDRLPVGRQRVVYMTVQPLCWGSWGFAITVHPDCLGASGLAMMAQPDCWGFWGFDMTEHPDCWGASGWAF